MKAVFSKPQQIANVQPLPNPLNSLIANVLFAPYPNRLQRRTLGTLVTRVWILPMLAMLSAMVGCGTTTNRVGTEQLLISNAIDEAVAQIDFGHLAGNKVYLDTTYLKADKKSGLVNTNYVISSLRQQLTAADCQIHDSIKDADVIVEPRIGAMGTDGHKVTYGIPKTGGLTAAASAFSGSPIGAIPEISFAQSDALSGIAKVVVFAYDSTTRQPIWQSGTAKAESNSTSTWVLGAGPFQKGSVYDSTRFAGREINTVGHGNVLRSGLIRNPSSTSASKTDALRYDSAHVFSSSTVTEIAGESSQESNRGAAKSASQGQPKKPVQQASFEN